MAVTTGDSIYYTTGTQPESASNESSTQASSVQRAFDKRQRFDYVWADATARTAQVGMVAGSVGYQLDTRSDYIYSGSAWQLKTPHAEFTNSTSMTATYATVAAWTLDASATTDTTFVVPGTTAGTLSIANPGVYAITVSSTYSPSSGTSGTLDIARSGSSVGPIIRSRPVQFLDSLSAAIANFRTTAANQSVYINGNAASSGITASMRIAITRLA